MSHNDSNIDYLNLYAMDYKFIDNLMPYNNSVNFDIAIQWRKSIPEQ